METKPPKISISSMWADIIYWTPLVVGPRLAQRRGEGAHGHVHAHPPPAPCNRKLRGVAVCSEGAFRGTAASMPGLNLPIFSCSVCVYGKWNIKVECAVCLYSTVRDVLCVMWRARVGACAVVDNPKDSRPPFWKSQLQLEMQSANRTFQFQLHECRSRS